MVVDSDDGIKVSSKITVIKDDPLTEGPRVLTNILDGVQITVDTTYRSPDPGALQAIFDEMDALGLTGLYGSEERHRREYEDSHQAVFDN